METVEIEGLEHDDTTIEDQEVMVTREETRPEMRNAYSHFMDRNDTANDCALEAVASVKTFHWTTAAMRWIICGAVLGNNAWKLYQSATGHVEMTRRQWRHELLSALVHEEGDMHPASVPQPKIRLEYCKSCWMLNKKRSRTTWRCEVCGPICKNCEQERGHEQFVNSVAPLNVRRHREEGSANVLERRDRKASASKLVY
eukprot:TRINITY_DN581_c0_g1_i6.p2 TRINITY_DN581_c0_g1~~TRINITY_DN581_c0_g1_i6.p2  ORF type:complete len:200 (+),score=36.91 TRINITY_DN581_c0_g1_i6:755-1354(+)